MSDLPDHGKLLKALELLIERLNALESGDELAQIAMSELGRVFDVDGGSFYLRDSSGLALGSSLDPGHAARTLPLPLRSESPFARAERAGKPLLLTKLASHDPESEGHWTGYRDDTALLIPFISSSRGLVGAVALHNRRTVPFAPAHVTLANILSAYLVTRLALFAQSVDHADLLLHHQAVFENSPNGIMLIGVTPDKHFRFLRVNPAVRRLSGFSTDQIEGRYIEEVLPPSVAEELAQNYRRCIENEAITEVQGSVNLRAGTRFVRSILVPLRSHDGRIDQIVALPSDQTYQTQVEEALEESESRYREVFENTSDGILVCEVTPERRFRVLATNPALQEIVELPAATGHERFLDELFPPEATRVLIAEYNRCADSKSPTRFEVEVTVPSGRRYLQTTLVPIGSSAGTVTRLIGVYRDMTEMITAQRALRLSEEKFSKAFHASPDSISISRVSDGRLIEVNRGFTRIIGYTRDQAVGHSALATDLGLWANLEERDRLVERLRNQGEVTDFEAQLRGKSGSIRHTLLSARIVEIDGEQCLLTVAQDLSERRKMEAALRESERRYREIFDNTSDGIFVVEVMPRQRYRVQSMNRAQGEMLGIDHERVIGKYHEEFLPPEVVRSVKEDNRQCLEAGRPMTFESSFDLPQGRRSYLTTLVPIRDGSESFARIIGVVRDMTERMEAEIREREHERQLLQAARLVSLGTLVSGIAHEINNPNNFIRLSSQNLNEFWPDIRSVLDEEEQRGGGLRLRGIPYGQAKELIEELLAGIDGGAVRIERLLVGLRDYARDAPGDLDGVVPLNAVVDSAILITRDLVRKSTDNLIVEKAQELPDARGDYHQIEQVLINLLTNACQALSSRDQKILVRTGTEHLGGWPTIQVSDEGSGIDPAVLSQITDPFFTTKRESGGSGLGLAVSSRIIAKHGGSMSFDSQPGSGTVVTIRLPCAELP